MKLISPHGFFKPDFHRALSTDQQSIYHAGIAKNLLSCLIILLFVGNSSFSFSQSCFTTDFSTAITTGATPAANTWYIDRYKPAAFISQQTIGTRSNTLKQSILAADGQAITLPDMQSAENTQGRALDLPSGSISMEINLLVSSDFSSASNRRLAGFWGTAFNGNTISAYPIIEFTTTGGSPRFRGYESGTGAWVDLGLPPGFVYDQWVTLKIKLVSGGEFEYKVITAQGSLQHTTTSNSSDGSTRIGNVILQGYNTPPPGVSYDIYWDDFGASSGASLVKNTNTGKVFCTIQAAIDDSETVNGHTIALSPGVYKEDINVNKSLTIQGTAPAETIIEGTYAGSTKTVIVSAANVTIKNLTITRDYGTTFASWKSSTKTEGIIVENVDNLTLDNLIVKGNRNGVYVHSSKGFVVKNSDITDNRTGFQIWGDLTGGQILNNKITNNFTHGIVFNFEQGTSIGKDLIIKDNFLAGNWYSQMNMQASSKGANAGEMSGMDISCNYFGPAISYSEMPVTGAPGYDTQVPTQFSGANTNTNTAYSLSGNNASLTNFNSFYTSGTISATVGFMPSGSCTSPVHNITRHENYAVIQLAIYSAMPDDSIVIDAGTYNDLLLIDKSLIFAGAGANICGTGARPGSETILNAPLTGGNLLINLAGTVSATFNGFVINGNNVANITQANQNLKIKNSVLQLQFLTNGNNIYFNSNTLTLECNDFRAISGTNVGGNSSHIFFTGAALNASNNKFTSEPARTPPDNSMNASTSSLPVWFNITTNANNVNIHDNDFAKVDIGILLAGNAGNVKIENNNFSEALRQNLPFGSGMGAGIALFQDLAPANPILIRYNKFSASETGIRTSGSGTEFPAANLLTISYNSFLTMIDKAISVGSTYSAASTKLNAVCNWYGAVTGPVLLSNNGASLPGAQILDGGNRVNYKNWLIYGDANDSQIGFQLPASVPVSPGNNASQAENHYRILSNAIGCATTGQEIQLSGTFDYSPAIAKNEWAKGNDGVEQSVKSSFFSGSGDDYSILAPAKTENVTVTSASPGSATILGPGEVATTALESFLFFNSNSTTSSFKGWTISNLIIKNFDASIAADHNNGSSFAMENFKVLNNEIYIPADNNKTTEADDFQNIGIHLNYGKNQEIKGNKIVIDGTGISDGTTSYSNTVALQSATSGGNLYDGLKIQNNQIRITGIPNASNPARIVGIWENSNSQTAAVNVSGNTFLNEDAGNLAENNKQLAFRITSFSGNGSQQIIYENNEISGFNRGFDWIGDPFSSYTANSYVTGNTPVIVRNNKIDNVKYGLTIRKGSGSISGSPAVVNNNSFSNIVTNGYAIVNEGSGDQTDATCNWYDNPLTVNVISAIGGGVKYLPKLSNGVDDSGATGFQLNAANTCVSPVLNQNSGITYITIQEAVNAASPNDVIRVSEGIYPENVLVNKSVTIYGVDSSLVIVDKGLSNRNASGGVGFLLQSDNIKLLKMKVQNFNNGIETDIATTGVIIDSMNINRNFSNGFFGKRTVTNMIIRKSNLNSNGYNSDDITRSGLYMRGIMFESQGSSINNLLIEDNQTDANGLVGIDISSLIPINGLKIQTNKSRGNFDSQIGVALGNNLLTGAPVIISGNTVVVSKAARYGIEIKNPLGSGAASGNGSIAVSGNIISLANHTGNNRDLAAIAVMRRKDGHAIINDQPQGVRVIDNIINNFMNIGGADAFGIVLGGTGHMVSGNTISNTQYPIQLQKGNVGFEGNENSPSNSGQTNNAYFDRDNSADVCVEVGANTITGSGDVRLVTGASNSTTTLPAVRTENSTLGTKFCTIQQAIDFNATVNTHVLKATAGTYPENVLVNKSITLQGPNEAVDGNGTRGAEASIIPGTDDVSGGILVKVTSNNVTIKGFSIDGSTSAFTQNIVINGVRTHAAFGVLAFGAISGLTVSNNVIKNLSKHGIDLDASGSATSSNLINNNKFDNIPRYDAGGFYGRGILMANNFYASVLDNTFSRVERGIQTNNFQLAAPSGDWLIKGNNIKAYNIGALINLHYQLATELRFENNIIDKDATARTVSTGDNLPDENFTGVEVFSINNTAKVTLKGGEIKNAVAGIYSWNNSMSNNVTVDGITFDNNITALMQSNTSRYGDAHDSEIAVQNVTIVDGDAQKAFVAEDVAPSHAISSINLLTANVITTGATFTQPFYLTGGAKARIQVGNTNLTLSSASLDAFTFNNLGTSSAPNVVIKSGFVVNLAGNDKRVLNLPSGAILEVAGNFTAPNKVGMNPVLINGSIWFTGGILNSGDGSIEFGPTGSDIMTGAHTETATSYILGKALMTSRAVGTGSIDMLGVKFGTGSNLGTLIITRTTKTSGSITPAFPADASIRTVWDITPSVASASRGDVQFRYLNNPENLNSQVPGAIYAYRYNLGTSLWEKKSALLTSTPPSSPSVDIYTTGSFGVPEFSSWTLSSAEPGPDLLPILSMTDNNFTSSSLTKSLTIRLFNITPGNTSNPDAPILVSIGKPSTYTIALSGASSSTWTLTNLNPVTVLLTSNSGTTITNGTSLDIPLTITAASGTSNGLSNLNINIENGSGGEANNTNNSETRKLLRQP